MSANVKPRGNQSGAKARLRLWLRVLRVTRLMEADLRDNLRREFDSTLPRFDVLAALHRYDGIRMNQLSGVLKVSNGNVTGIVDRLVEDELVIRESVPEDRRAWHVKLTRKGHNEFNRQALEHEQWVNELLSSLPLDKAIVMSRWSRRSRPSWMISHTPVSRSALMKAISHLRKD